MREAEKDEKKLEEDKVNALLAAGGIPTMKMVIYVQRVLLTARTTGHTWLSRET